MSRTGGGVKRKGQRKHRYSNTKRDTADGACPVPRNELVSFVLDVAGAGDFSRTVLNTLLDSNSSASAKQRVDEAVRLAGSSECSIRCHSQHHSLQAAAAAISVVADSSMGEPALDVRVAGDCAQAQGVHQEAQVDVNIDRDTQPEQGTKTEQPEEGSFEEGGSLLRLEHVGAHELLHISQLLKEDSRFDGIALVVKQPLDCETRTAAVMAALLVLLDSLRTCQSLHTINIAFKVHGEEGRQSAVGIAIPPPQVVITELRRVVTDCVWLKGCRFRVPVCASRRSNSQLQAEWKAQRRERVVAVRAAVVMAYNARLGARSALRNLPAEVMTLLLDKTAPSSKFDLDVSL